MCLRTFAPHAPSKDLLIAQPPVLEPEIALFPLTPVIFPVKVKVAALLIVVCYRLRLMRSFEPCEVLLVEPPVLFL
jgi:hypothetical protein